MIFPEATLPGVNDFKCWYSGGTYSNGTEAPGVINIFFDENHNVVSVERAGGTRRRAGAQGGRGLAGELVREAGDQGEAHVARRDADVDRA